MKIHCHRCQRLIGESSASALTFVGMFKSMQDRHNVEGQRDTWACKGCGWVTVFQPEGSTSGNGWRGVELKRAQGG